MSDNAVKRSVTVKATPQKAFEVFTAGMGRWWPKEHSIGSSAQASVIVEPMAGGRWYERGEDGSETAWGRVVDWSPPSRLLLDWQIGGTWTCDPTLHTAVEVTFADAGDGRTTVTLEHRDLDRFGEQAAQMKAGFEAEGGWGAILALYAGIAA